MSYKITQKCIGCTLCKKNCPVDAIEGNLKQKHIINGKRCVECGVCGRVCPQGAVEDKFGCEIQRVSKEQRTKPTIDTSVCSACGICVDICAFTVLAISVPRVKGDKDAFAQVANSHACVGCNLCEKSCPIGAITMWKTGDKNGTT